MVIHLKEKRWNMLKDNQTDLHLLLSLENSKKKKKDTPDKTVYKLTCKNFYKNICEVLSKKRCKKDKKLIKQLTLKYKTVFAVH